MKGIPELIKNIQSPYDYWAWWHWLEVKGKRTFGDEFKLYPEDAEIILKLLVWCVQDEENADKLKISLWKGLMLAGGTGTGKTSLMTLIRHILPSAMRHWVKPCREIAMSYAQEGYDVLCRYTKLSFHPHTSQPIPFCFDDLGLELDLVTHHFTNSCNVMAEILLSRYDYFVSHRMLTHVTTNLNSQDIEQYYGKRVRSRCREMFNLISFPANAPDKRK